MAKRLGNGSTSISNGVSLGTDFTLDSVHVVQHAVASGWWPEAKIKEFHFQHAYSRGTSKSEPVVTRVHPRATRSRRLLEERAGQIDPRWMMHIARSPGINLDATASSCVAILPDTKDQLPVFWWCASVPESSCYVPFFVHSSGLPQIVSTAGIYGNRIESPSKVARDEFSDRSYWWLFRDLSDRVAANRDQRRPVVREAFDALEKEFEAGIADVVHGAARFRKGGRTEKAANVLDGYTAECLNKVLLRVNELRIQFADR